MNFTLLVRNNLKLITQLSPSKYVYSRFLRFIINTSKIAWKLLPQRNRQPVKAVDPNDWQANHCILKQSTM